MAAIIQYLSGIGLDHLQPRIPLVNVQHQEEQAQIESNNKDHHDLKQGESSQKSHLDQSFHQEIPNEPRTSQQNQILESVLDIDVEDGLAESESPERSHGEFALMANMSQYSKHDEAKENLLERKFLGCEQESGNY